MKHLIVAILMLTISRVWADDGYGPSGIHHHPSSYKVPPGMVLGGAFVDRIQPMPVEHGLSADAWGGTNVLPRNVENGLEDATWSYWCMDVTHGVDGKEHMFACRWPKAGGHNAWPSSRIVYAVADKPTGPFIVKQEVGPGCNVWCYQAKDGSYVLYYSGGGYSAKSMEGPWTKFDIKYDLRGTPGVEMSNFAFTPREDGSILMVSRAGQTWISEDGLKPFNKITIKSPYPSVPGNYEDPAMWRDEVQYNMIVNDWSGRTAFYLRSRDGVDWVWDQGIAYDTHIVRHADGTRENWHKFERPNVRQDAFGRATHLYAAVIDCPKDMAAAGSNHSSKIIALPLTVQRRLAILNGQPITASTPDIQVVIKAEEGFDPATEVDEKSLTFGAPTEVDFGRGCKPLKSSQSGKDLIVTFSGEGNGFKPADYTGKLLGRNKRGEMIFGYVRLPGQSFINPILAARSPEMAKPGIMTVKVENFGQVESKPAEMKWTITSAAGRVTKLSVKVPPILPYTNSVIAVALDSNPLKSDKPCNIETRIEDYGGSQPLVLQSALRVQ